jgi:hypothetical protein
MFIGQIGLEDWQFLLKEFEVFLGGGFMDFFVFVEEFIFEEGPPSRQSLGDHGVLDLFEAEIELSFHLH